VISLSRFKGHYFLHDRGVSEDARKLASIVEETFNSKIFNQPQPLYEFKEDATALEAYRGLRTYFLPDTLINSVIFGVGLGGLLAAKLQEEFPARNLSVVTINAPTVDGDIGLEGIVMERLALYSSGYPPISNHCDWSNFASQVYDIPSLQYGIKNVKYGLAHILAGYMQKEEVKAEAAIFRTWNNCEVRHSDDLSMAL
jgi:pimeloyl-ACP methyl ester carboxylesterase